MRLHVHAPGLDLREVEDVVDDRQQRLAAVADRRRHVALVVGQQRVEQHAAHADHPVHRRADLVAHRREERTLRLVRALGRFARALLGGHLVLEQCTVDALLVRTQVLVERGDGRGDAADLVGPVLPAVRSTTQHEPRRETVAMDDGGDDGVFAGPGAPLARHATAHEAVVVGRIERDDGRRGFEIACSSRRLAVAAFVEDGGRAVRVGAERLSIVGQQRVAPDEIGRRVDGATQRRVRRPPARIEHALHEALGQRPQRDEQREQHRAREQPVDDRMTARIEHGGPSGLRGDRRGDQSDPEHEMDREAIQREAEVDQAMAQQCPAHQRQPGERDGAGECVPVALPTASLEPRTGDARRDVDDRDRAEARREPGEALAGDARCASPRRPQRGHRDHHRHHAQQVVDREQHEAAHGGRRQAEDGQRKEDPVQRAGDDERCEDAADPRGAPSDAVARIGQAEIHEADRQREPVDRVEERRDHVVQEAARPPRVADEHADRQKHGGERPHRRTRPLTPCDQRRDHERDGARREIGQRDDLVRRARMLRVGGERDFDVAGRRAIDQRQPDRLVDPPEAPAVARVVVLETVPDPHAERGQRRAFSDAREGPDAPQDDARAAFHHRDVGTRRGRDVERPPRRRVVAERDARDRPDLHHRRHDDEAEEQQLPAAVRGPHHRSAARCDAEQRLDEPLDADRLRQVVVHAGRETRFAVALHRVRGHRDDPRTPIRPALRRCDASPRDRPSAASARPSTRRRIPRARPARSRPTRRPRGPRDSPSAEAVASRASGSRRCPRPAGSAADAAMPSPGRRPSSADARSAASVAAGARISKRNVLP